MKRQLLQFQPLLLSNFGDWILVDQSILTYSFVTIVFNLRKITFSFYYFIESLHMI